MSRDTSVYVHFPWCLSKCPYCDFATRPLASTDIPSMAYADAVRGELDRRAAGLGGRRLVSVFFGGGTPSLWDPPALGSVLAAIRAAFDEEALDLEVTAECNPSSLDRAGVAALRAQGVGRLSIGVQSLDDAHLRHLGRRHDAAGALQALKDARAEMERVSADLMFGVPDQSAASLLDEAQRLLDLGIDHLSAYALTIEPGTLFGELHRRGKLRVSSDEVYADLFEALARHLTDAGLDHYEVSNYARPGQEARHNLHYWRGGDYLGLGAAAVGCTAERPGHARRWRNLTDPRRYMEAASAPEPGPCGLEEWDETLDADILVREALLLGLRTSEGVDVARTAARAGIGPDLGRAPAVEAAVGRGNLVREDGTLRVPRDRWLRLDGIVAELF